jgi:hypothetical protein
MPTNKIKTHVKNIHGSIFLFKIVKRDYKIQNGVKVGGKNRAIDKPGGPKQHFSLTNFIRNVLKLILFSRFNKNIFS